MEFGKLFERSKSFLEIPKTSRKIEERPRSSEKSSKVRKLLKKVVELPRIAETFPEYRKTSQKLNELQVLKSLQKFRELYINS